MRNTLRMLFFLFFAAAKAAAAEKPAELAGVIKASAPYGYATYRALFMDIYDADLWTDAHPWRMDVPFALTLTYHMGFSSQELSDKSMEEMNHAAALLPEQETQNHAVMEQGLPNVADGDRITALYQPGKSLRFFHNGKLTATTKDMAFAQAFLGIWLGKNSSEPAFRAKLIAAH